MDHAYIDEHNLIDLYHQGRLEPEEEMRFEEHFVACTRCQEELEVSRNLQKGLRRALVEEAQQKAVTQLGLLAWLARLSQRTQAGIVLGLLLLVALPFVWFGQRNAELRDALVMANEQATDWRLRHEDAEQRRAALETERVAEQQNWQLERNDFEAQLQAQPQGQNQPVIDKPRAWTNTPLFLLGKIRSGDAQNEVDLSAVDERLTLAVDAFDDGSYVNYQITITRPDGSVAWHRDGLRPNALEVLMITFPKTFLAPGAYRLTVAGVSDDGEAIPVDSYPFEIKA